MANRHRGEIAATIDGKERVLCLTLGALAELEAAFDAPDLIALAERFETGRLKAGDAVAILTAGLRGGGADVTQADVAAMSIDGGAAAGVRLVSELLSVTFGGE